MPGNRPAIDYNPNVGLMVVAGELCGTGGLWCNIATKKTLLSSDGGLTFAELAEFPEMVMGTCGLFLNDTTFMVIGGREFGAMRSTGVFDETWFYDVPSNTWSSGPVMPIGRSYHSCILITDCDGNNQVVVVGGSYLNRTDIYDVNSGNWTTGNDYPYGIQGAGATHYKDSFIIAGGSEAAGNRAEIYYYDIVNGGTWTFLTNLTGTCSNLAGGYCFGPNIIILDENDSPCP